MPVRVRACACVCVLSVCLSMCACLEDLCGIMVEIEKWEYGTKFYHPFTFLPFLEVKMRLAPACFMKPTSDICIFLRF